MIFLDLVQQRSTKSVVGAKQSRGLPVTFARCRNRNRKRTNIRRWACGARVSGIEHLSNPDDNPWRRPFHAILSSNPFRMMENIFFQLTTRRPTTHMHALTHTELTSATAHWTPQTRSNVAYKLTAAVPVPRWWSSTTVAAAHRHHSCGRLAAGITYTVAGRPATGSDGCAAVGKGAFVQN